MVAGRSTARSPLARGVYRSGRPVFGQYEYSAVMHGGRTLEVWRPRMGETEPEVTAALWALLDLLDPAPVEAAS